MRLARMTDYAVVVLSHMVRQEDGKVVNASTLSELTGLPLPTVSKILKILAAKKIITAFRGVNGGYGLGRSAEEISAREIIVALEGPVALAACVDTGDDLCDFKHSCPIKGNWNPVNEAIYEALEKVSLRDMAMPRPQSPCHSNNYDFINHPSAS